MTFDVHRSLLSQLRAATSGAHADLDGKLAPLDGALSKERYERFLCGSLVALVPLEAALAAWVTPSIERCGLIRADLAALGSALPPLGEHHPVSIENLAQAYGARYVMEGSALGGAVLARAFQRALGLGDDSLQYLRGRGAQLGEHWRAFTSELEAWGKSVTDPMRAEACTTARSMFELYSDAFEAAGAFSWAP